MRSPTLAAALTATLLSTAAAAAAEPAAEDWRASACIDQGQIDLPGPSEFPALRPIEHRGQQPSAGRCLGWRPGRRRPLDFSGVTCEVLYVEGALPQDAVVDVVANSWCANFAVVIDGEKQPPSGTCSSVGSPTRLYSRGGTTLPMTFSCLPCGRSVPTTRRCWRTSPACRRSGQAPPSPVTTQAPRGGSFSPERRGCAEFDRSRDTDRAARAAYARQVRRATRTYDERVARIEQSHRSQGWKMWRLQQAKSVRKDALAGDGPEEQRLALAGIHLTLRPLPEQPPRHPSAGRLRRRRRLPVHMSPWAVPAICSRRIRMCQAPCSNISNTGSR